MCELLFFCVGFFLYNGIYVLSLWGCLGVSVCSSYLVGLISYKVDIWMQME